MSNLRRITLTQEELERAALESAKQYLLSHIDEAKQYLLRNIEKRPGPLETECWIWTGPVHPKGYGVASYCGHHEAAHRFFFRVFVGEIPRDKQINHRCHIKPCVRPSICIAELRLKITLTVSRRALPPIYASQRLVGSRESSVPRLRFYKSVSGLLKDKE
jgi:hypothetical protein